MPNIFKHLSRPKVEIYQFPDAAELVTEELREEAPPPPAQAEPETVEEYKEKESSQASSEPINYAKIQAEVIIQQAHCQAEAILERSRKDAQQEAEGVYADARDTGYQAGYAQGAAQAMEDAARKLKEDAEAQEMLVQQFLERAAAALDRQLDENVEELRDLALAVAEKVVCVSLRSSSDVIARMIQTAVDKRKRREWVHIYIAGYDAKRMTQVPPSLTTVLAALSDRVRIIPMADDESGTCIIEMPDEIIDASAGTQLNNIRRILLDAPSGGGI